MPRSTTNPAAPQRAARSPARVVASLGRGFRWLALAVLLLGSASVAVAADELVAFVGARIHTVAEGAAAPIDDGVLVVEGAVIAALGPVASTPVRSGARRVDLAGRVIVPGLVDTHTHIGIYPRPLLPAHSDGNDAGDAVQPQLRAIDAIWPDDPGIRMALAGGITTANIMPGSGSVVSGQTAYVKLRGDSVEEMLILPPDRVQGGLKLANGENPKLSNEAKPPFTRMAIAALERDLFDRARRYARKWSEYRKQRDAGAEAEEPDLDRALEPVVEVLEGRRTVHHHTHRADDIATVLRLREEYGFDVVLHHASEAWMLPDRIAAAGVPVSGLALDSPGGKLEAARYRLDYLGILERAGVVVAIHSDDFITESRLFLRSGALAVRGGMSAEGALRALTLNGARMLHLEDRVGSLEVGKDADFVVLSGPPFATRTHVLETWIDGERVFDRADPVQRVWATGGPGLVNPGDRPLRDGQP